MSTSRVEMPYDAPPRAREALNRLGQTEDLRLSSDNRRLAITGYMRDTVGIVDLDITTVTNVEEVSSSGLQRPHGVAFLDDETIIVANREGTVAAFRLPSRDGVGTCAELIPIDLRSGREFELLDAPGSLAVTRVGDGEFEVLVCNNVGNTITRHRLRLDDHLAVEVNEVLLSRWLSVPDGAAVSADNRWIAISNHDCHVVMVYDRASALEGQTEPRAVLRGAVYPHGLRFTDDGLHLFVADAETPFLHVFARRDPSWQGVHYPQLRCRSSMTTRSSVDDGTEADRVARKASTSTEVAASSA